MESQLRKLNIRGPFCEYGIEYVPLFSKVAKETLEVSCGETVALDCEPSWVEGVKFQWFYFTLAARLEKPLKDQTSRGLRFKVGDASRTTHFRFRAQTENGQLHVSRWILIRIKKAEKPRRVVFRNKYPR